MALSFVFPGQGSQAVGMLADLAAAEPAVAATFAEASDVLGYDLWALAQHGPAERLNATECTQPAMLAAGVAAWRAWEAAGGPPPQSLAGHSLGEFTALVCAGVIGFRDAIALVQFRGRAMQDAVPQGVGAMAAILGLDDAAVEAACAEAAAGEVVAAVNYNSPGQLVIAGHATAVARAIDACKARGAKRAVTLPVSVPSHSALMQPAAEQLRDRLAGMTLATPSIRTYAFDGSLHETPAGIRDALYRQLFNPVRWSKTVATMIADGGTHFVECGPGKVLAGLVRRAEGGKTVDIQMIEDAKSLAAALAANKGAGA